MEKALYKCITLLIFRCGAPSRLLFVSSYPTSVSGIIVLLNIKHLIKVPRIILYTDSSFWPFCDKIFRVKIFSFHIGTNYRM